METKYTRREAFALIVGGVIAAPRLVSLCIGSFAYFVLVGCGRDPRKPSSSTSAPVVIAAGKSVETALRQKTSIATRPTSWGEEIVRFGTWTATKGAAADDGFVFLVNGIPLGGPSRDHPIFGSSTIEVRYVPFGRDGQQGTSLLTFNVVTI